MDLRTPSDAFVGGGYDSKVQPWWRNSLEILRVFEKREYVVDGIRNDLPPFEDVALHATAEANAADSLTRSPEARGLANTSWMLPSTASSKPPSQYEK